MGQFHSTRGYARTLPTPSRAKDAPIPPHKFNKNDELGTDWRGDHFCRDCRKAGKEGDKNHPAGALPLPEVLNPPQLPPVPDAVRDFEARRLGETS